MKTLTLLLVLFIQTAYCQNSEKEKLRLNGETAYINKDFKTAKDSYEKLIVLDTLNKDAWYNLAATELNLGNTECACENFYKAYQLDNREALKEIKKHCPNFRNGTIMSIDDVDEKPKFLYKGKEYYLYGEEDSYLYLSLVGKALTESSRIAGKIKGRIIIEMNINASGKCDVKIVRNKAVVENPKIVEKELKKIFINLVTYVPAKHNGKNVEVLEKWFMPLKFEEDIIN